MTLNRLVLGLGAVALTTAAAVLPAVGQDAYPSRSVTMVVPFPPGGSDGRHVREGVAKRPPLEGRLAAISGPGT
jgi:hypothetical protein